MSNKKRISRKIASIRTKKHLKLLSSACKVMVEIINKTLEERRKHSITLGKYPKGGLIPNDGTPEKIIDSYGDERIVPKFEIKRHIPYYLDSHKPIQS